MKKIYDLEEWGLDDALTNPMRKASVSIFLPYPDYKNFIDLTPKERVKAINKNLSDNFGKLIKSSSFSSYEIIGTKKNPRGLETSVFLSDIKKLSKHPFVGSIHIKSIDGVKKTYKTDPVRFFCVKLTLVAQVEGMENGLQTFDESYVLIKAKTHEDAYQKIENQSKKYETTYLNPKGELVRWKIESFEDCFETGITNLSDMKELDGMEVFSILKKRKMTKERYWDGELD